MDDRRALRRRGQGGFQHGARGGQVFYRAARRNHGHAITDAGIADPGDAGGAGQVDVQARYAGAVVTDDAGLDGLVIQWLAAQSDAPDQPVIDR